MDLINSTHAWFKNERQDRSAAGGSLGVWILSREPLPWRTWGRGALESGLELKPQEFIGVTTMSMSCVRTGLASTARPQMGPEPDVRV